MFVCNSFANYFIYHCRKKRHLKELQTKVNRMEMNGGDFMFPFRGRLFRRLELGNPGAILSTAASSDDSTIATCSTDTKVLLWDLSSGKRVNCLQGHTAEVTTCCFGDDLLATGSRDGVVILWKYQTGKRVSRICKHLCFIILKFYLYCPFSLANLTQL